MKPTLGRIVILRTPSEVMPAIITAVHSDTLVNVSAFLPNGNVSGYGSVQQKGTGPEGGNTWEWPEIAATLATAEPLMGESLMGGFNVLGLLGGDFGAIAGPLLLMLYQSNKDRITSGADRIMTPPASAVDYVLDRLGIHDSAKRSAVTSAVQAWGDKGGDVLVALADAKAGV